MGSSARKKPERQPLPQEDALLNHRQAAALLGIHPKNWWGYAKRWPVLLEGARVVRVTPGTRGRMRWLRSAVVRHMHEELRFPEVGEELSM